MIAPLASSFFLSAFSFFNLFGIKPNLVANQVLFFVISILIFLGVRKLGPTFFKNNSNVFYRVFVALLILTFIVGTEIKGSKRWIDLYFFNFQSSEFLKVFFITFFAHYFSSTKKYADQFSIFLKSIAYFVVPTLIIFLQPDLGNAAVYVFIYFILLLFSSTPKKYIAYLVICIMLLIPSGFFFLKDYQKARLTSFFTDTADQRGASYNMTQAVITTGSGKFLGRGLGYGTQSKLLYLPENHTDFAFSSLIEQFGFVGGIVVLGLYVVIIMYLLKKALKYGSGGDEETQYYFLYIIGFLAYFSFQTFVNIAMNMGLLPIVGIALPFISYGGSALVTLAIGLALLP